MSNSPEATLSAILLSPCPPAQEQHRRMEQVLSQRLGQPVSLTWQEDKTIAGGFRIQVGAQTIDWTAQGRLEQLKEQLSALPTSGSSVIPLIRDTVAQWEPQIQTREVGTVITAADGIVSVSGLPSAAYGEVLLFENGVRGMVQNLSPEKIDCILFDELSSISEGSTVRCSGKTAGIPVGDAFLGRVVNALGVPIDGKGPISPDGYRAIEHPAPGIVDRQSVDTPMETGILTIDSMFPIGRGQRELIIGDRQTGKTSIAIDTILNQQGKNVVCIYVAIGQKVSSVAQITQQLQSCGALDHTVIVCAGAGESASMQYIAPYAGTAIGEYFMERGLDVLIVYDDLSKHAIAYRTLSLLLGRSPGREAYPGDVFYLHSRLLERSAHLSDARGGGSMTALPIVETQAGDVSAYIPTNIISITDGQLFLESNLFFSGQRPAVNVGLSVSRVGGAAQTKTMKQAVGSLRLDLAQYREMAVFTQFSSDLDEDTQKQLQYGQSLMHILRQGRSSPLSMAEQIITLVSAMGHIYQPLPTEQIAAFQRAMLDTFHQQQSPLLDHLEQGTGLTDTDRTLILSVAKEALARFQAGNGR